MWPPNLNLHNLEAQPNLCPCKLIADSIQLTLSNKSSYVYD